MNIVVNQTLCDPEQCGQECLSVCPQNKKGIETIDFKDNKITLNKSSCTECLLCIDKCPCNAIELINNNEIPINDKYEEIYTEANYKYPFKIDNETYNPFSEKNTIFARVNWDQELNSYKKSTFSGAQNQISLQKDGYSNFEFFAAQAAWNIENLVTQKEFNQYKEYNILGTQEKNKFPKSGANGYKPEELTTWIKKLAKYYGADLVGITSFDQKWFYENNRQGEKYNFPVDIRSVIVLAIEMDEGGINTAPKMPSMVATGLGYSKTAFVRSILSEFITNMGFNAITAGNQIGLSVPLAVMAGLGGYGRHGLLITKPYGSRVRIAKILTDMPLIFDKPNYKFINSVNRFCKTCKTCAEKCPSASISLEDEPTNEIYSISNNPGINKFYINVDTCYDFWVKNGGDCSRCISDCEYNHNPKFRHKIAHFMIQYFPIFNSIWPFIGRLFGYGGNKSAKKFWKKSV